GSRSSTTPPTRSRGWGSSSWTSRTSCGIASPASSRSYGASCPTPAASPDPPAGARRRAERSRSRRPRPPDPPHDWRSHVVSPRVPRPLPPRGRRPAPRAPREGPEAGRNASPIEVAVERLSADGEGVASWNGRALFVPGALPGEQVRVAPAVEGKVQRGALLEVLRPAPERITPGCPLAGACGGGDWFHRGPAAQRGGRERAGRSGVGRRGGVDLRRVAWLPTVAAGDLGPRRRADLQWTGTRLGYLRSRSHTPVAVE